MRRALESLVDDCFPLSCAGCGVRRTVLCARCLAACRGPERPPPAGIDAWAVAAAYRGAVRDAVIAAKYRRHHRVLDAFAALLAYRARALGPMDAVVAPPAARAHFAGRGYDPARRLALGVARHLDRPFLDALRRDDSAPQTGRRRVERLSGPRLRPARPVPARVLVVDDVVTTGGTLMAVGGALRRAGAAEVLAVVVARRA